MKRMWLWSIAAGLGVVWIVSTVPAMPADSGTFNESDTRVFKTAACTKDQVPMEALYYIVPSRADIEKGTPSPTAQLMKEEVDRNWALIAAALTKDEVMEERFADRYDAVVSDSIPLLQKAVKDKSGWTIQVTEVNSRPMDAALDANVPSCRLD